MPILGNELPENVMSNQDFRVVKVKSNQKYKIIEICRH